ncbi:PAS domain-containing protein (plasmid) [Agrobacterium sp. rho-8.1]|nr:PAS domain-containing protein [Agrobacterium sp. rho-8.1]
MVWRAGDGGNLTWSGPQWTVYTGQAESESHGMGWLDPVHPEDRDTALMNWSKAAEMGGFEVEYRIREASTDEYRWFHTRATPVRDENGNIIEWLGTSTDVEDLRSLQARQEALVAELRNKAAP